jgi:aspartate/methionine/tyrosine aminotransferase
VFIFNSNFLIKLNLDELKAAFTSKTKVIIINTPNNPLGKVYTKEELQTIADLCIKNNTICIADEVYEHLTYDKPHLRIGFILFFQNENLKRKLFLR